jgi:outer membrane murein-binding lipoprotein Lpp
MSTVARRLPTRRPSFGWIAAGLMLVVTGAAIGWALNTQAVADDGRSVETVARQASSATEAIDALSERLKAVRKDIAALEAGNERAAARLDRVTGSLWASLRKTRGLVAEARAGSSDALVEAESALQRAESAARNLSVLQDRFDYHLRVDHGGG